MIGYVCRYTPVELMQAMGADMQLMDAQEQTGTVDEPCMHPNLCVYAQSVMRRFAQGGYEGIVLITCCDSIRRLYDVMKQKYPTAFVFLLDLPHGNGAAAAQLYAQQLNQLVQAYQTYAHGTFDPVRLRQILAAEDLPEKPAPVSSNGLRIGILGARHTDFLTALLQEEGAVVSGDLSCAAQHRCIVMPSPASADVLRDYAAALLHQLPCLRMADVPQRHAAIQKIAAASDGLIYHTVKFCDFFAYEFAGEQWQVPVLKIETDLSAQSAGQLRTRVEAFRESLQPEGGKPMPNLIHPAGTAVLGMDSGSTTTCAALMDRQRHILASTVIRTGGGSEASARQAKQEVLAKAGLSDADLICTVATGYGRISIPFADQEVTEITCHARGARYDDPRVRTILDIGGQDSKAIHLNEAGEVTDFAMNDKCAAGTGRFLETMARILEVSLDELGPLSLRSAKRIEIASQCTVFAESEVISLIAQNEKKEDIAAAVHRAVAVKAAGLLNRVGMTDVCMMSGGVALNPGMRQAVEEKTGHHFTVAADPEIVGAVGACLSALDAVK